MARIIYNFQAIFAHEQLQQLVVVFYKSEDLDSALLVESRLSHALDDYLYYCECMCVSEDVAPFLATEYGILLVMGAGAVAVTALYGISRSCEKRSTRKIRKKLEQYASTLKEPCCAICRSFNRWFCTVKLFLCTVHSTTVYWMH